MPELTLADTAMMATAAVGWLCALGLFVRRGSPGTKMLRLVLDNMPFGVAIFNGERRLVLCNSKYATVYSLPPHLTKPGATQNDILHFRISHGIHDGVDARKYVQERVAIATQGKAKQTLLHLSNGHVLSVCHCPLPGGGWLSTHEDVTQRLAMERQANVLTEQAERREKLDAAIRSFRATVDQVMRQLCESADEMKSTAGELSFLSADVMSTVDGAVKDVSTASDGVEIAANSAAEMQKSIQEIEHQLVRATRIVTEAVVQTERTNDSVTSLSNTTSSISDVVKLIQSIAEQSNLLALNATIEAARAGESGRAFAVVANELRELALQTSNATEDIHSQINAVQSSAAGAIEIIQGIHKRMREIDEHTCAINAAVQQQSSATGEISGSIDAAAKGARTAATTFDGARSAMSKLQIVASDVLKAAEKVDVTASALQNDVEAFLRNVAA